MLDATGPFPQVGPAARRILRPRPALDDGTESVLGGLDATGSMPPADLHRQAMTPPGPSSIRIPALLPPPGPWLDTTGSAPTARSSASLADHPGWRGAGTGAR